ncbi:phosphotransferase enzyme family protein [Paenibacillus glycinis]|uniref:Phosphotransferase n=1 Tax=Paenibacillus glycinis TaxID=2697035 RepID=A0ABW9XZH0_9BACL|nr:phosphotransferase [Paenibacillus glycinis]NBD28134.1 phosphotransferase [Paenibacillus glycinis]
MTDNARERAAQDIAAQLESRFGLSVTGAMPIEKGWLNVKWKLETDRGPLFVKHYHPDRYKLHASPDRRSELERNLGLQHRMSEAGIPCPGVYGYAGTYIQETPSGLYYTVLDWVEGQTAEAGYLNAAQMFALGDATGRMHEWLRTHVPTGKLAWKPDKPAYWREWERNRKNAEDAEDRTVTAWLERSKAIVTSLDFGIFDSCPTGWLHWDLWVDNLVLREHGVAGIVDFDRMAVAYPEIDIARVVLSGTLRDGRIRSNEARAYFEGLRRRTEAPKGILGRSLRLLYVIESLWWLRAEVRRDSELRGMLARFVEEMHWIEAQWDSLSEQMDGY